MFGKAYKPITLVQDLQGNGGSGEHFQIFGGKIKYGINPSPPT